MEVRCSFESFAPYAFLFAGVGFFAGTVVVALLSHTNRAFDAILANGLHSQLLMAIGHSRNRWAEASQRAKQAESQLPASPPQRDENWL